MIDFGFVYIKGLSVITACAGAEPVFLSVMIQLARSFEGSLSLCQFELEAHNVNIML